MIILNMPTNIIVPVRGRKTTKMKNVVKKEKKKEKKELTKLGALLRTLGSGAGTTLGGYLGAPVAGASMGYSLGAALSKWLGSGDYQIQKNSLLSTGDIPMMHQDDQTVVIRHKEFVTELLGSQAFTVQKSMTINPGLPLSFPWLSKVAQNYTEYKVRGMVFHYVPTSGSAINSTNPALGSVMFQTTYRATDATPSSKVELLNEYCSNECVPSDTLCHPIECNPKENPFQIQYVRGRDVPAADSKLIYDLGVTHIATSGMPANGNVVGDVWVTYEIELKKPVVVSNVTNQSVSAVAYCVSSTTHTFSATTVASPGLSFDTANATNKIQIDVVPGKYYTVCLFVGYSAQAGGSLLTTAVSGGTLATGPYLAANSYDGNGTSTNGTTSIKTYLATANLLSITYTAPSYYSTNTYTGTVFMVAGYQ